MLKSLPPLLALDRCLRSTTNSSISECVGNQSSIASQVHVRLLLMPNSTMSLPKISWTLPTKVIRNESAFTPYCASRTNLSASECPSPPSQTWPGFNRITIGCARYSSVDWWYDEAGRAGLRADSSPARWAGWADEVTRQTMADPEACILRDLLGTIHVEGLVGVFTSFELRDIVFDGRQGTVTRLLRTTNISQVAVRNVAVLHLMDANNAVHLANAHHVAIHNVLLAGCHFSNPAVSFGTALATLPAGRSTLPPLQPSEGKMGWWIDGHTSRSLEVIGLVTIGGRMEAALLLRQDEAVDTAFALVASTILVEVETNHEYVTASISQSAKYELSCKHPQTAFVQPEGQSSVSPAGLPPPIPQRNRSFRNSHPACQPRSHRGNFYRMYCSCMVSCQGCMTTSCICVVEQLVPWPYPLARVRLLARCRSLEHCSCSLQPVVRTSHLGCIHNHCAFRILQ